MRLLDFGCGDGRLLELLSSVQELHAYDPSPGMLNLAKSRLGEALKRIYADSLSIPVAHFDVVVCSLVLMTIENKDEFVSTIYKIKQALRSGGVAVIGVTHPCFREGVFSDFETEYSVTKNFDYFAEGRPFSVTIYDSKLARTVAFEDFHWTLGFTVNSLINAGLNIVELSELPDNPESLRSNSRQSPYLLIIARRPEVVRTNRHD